MQKMIVSGTLVLVTALLLAACGGGGAVQTTPGALETSPVSTLPASTEPVVTEAAPTLAAPTLAATMPAVEETETLAPTEGAAVEPTSEPTTAAAPTTEVSSPPEPGTTFVRLTSLLQSNINAGSGMAGTVDGVLVEHPEPPVVVEEAEAGAATPTPAPTLENAVTNFTLRYVLVDTAGSEAAGTAGRGNIVVVPWQAFDFAAADGSVALRSDMDTLASAPHVSLAEIAANQPSLTEQVTAYWSDQSIAGIPVTGPVTENLALIPGDFRGVTIASAEGADFGAVSDFIVDAATGQIVSVVLNGGALFENREFVVPVDNLTWLGNSGMQLGGFEFNFPGDLLQNAPAIDLNNLTLNKAWFDMLNQFWGTVQGQ